MGISFETKYDFCDVMIVPKFSSLRSRSQVVLARSFYFQKCGMEMTAVPIMAANMDTVGTISMASALHSHNMMCCLHKHYSVEKLVEFFAKSESSLSFMTIGMSDEDLSKLDSVYNSAFKDKDDTFKICVDVANGYMDHFTDYIRSIRKTYWNSLIIAGNVVTPSGVHSLAKAGADIIKLGIGSGSLCTTRKKAGVGYPQFSAIMDCKECAQQVEVRLISDGGCTCPGDVAKAFCAGADFVMLGGMFAGHDECELDFITDGDYKYAYTYGMSSKHAMLHRNGGMADYRASEGKVVKIHPKGPVKETVQDLLGGLRSCGTYINAQYLKDFPENADFVVTNRQLNNYFDHPVHN